MSDHLQRFSSCPQITEWVTPWDERLVKVTGLQPPVDGKSLREAWSIQKSEIPELLTVVKHLLVPEPLTGNVHTAFDAADFAEDNTTGTVSLHFDDQADWRECLPVSEQTLVFDRHGVRGNAAIALCGKAAGLAVIAMEFYDEGELDFAVQPLRQEKLEQILAAC